MYLTAVIRYTGIYILFQKKPLELTQEESKSWFSEPQADDSNVDSTGYVLQGRDTSQLWENFTKEVGSSICGTAPKEDLERLFPRQANLKSPSGLRSQLTS